MKKEKAILEYQKSRIEVTPGELGKILARHTLTEQLDIRQSLKCPCGLRLEYRSQGESKRESYFAKWRKVFCSTCSSTVKTVNEFFKKKKVLKLYETVASDEFTPFEIAANKPSFYFQAREKNRSPMTSLRALLYQLISNESYFKAYEIIPIQWSRDSPVMYISLKSFFVNIIDLEESAIGQTHGVWGEFDAVYGDDGYLYCLGAKRGFIHIPTSLRHEFCNYWKVPVTNPGYSQKLMVLIIDNPELHTTKRWGTKRIKITLKNVRKHACVIPFSHDGSLIT